MAKILVVDDEVDLQTLIKQKFRKQIRAQQYEFVFAINGIDALTRLEEHDDVDIVLSDINMPEMDGLTLLTKLGEQNAILKSVIVSAYGDMENIRTAMNRGAYDFVTKPVDFKDLEVTIEKTLSHVGQLRKTLEAIRQNSILKMYVDESVLHFMETQGFEAALMKNETIEATVAFIDICGFTAFSEHEAPDLVVKMLNNYFDVMVKEIIAQEGLIDKFMGDATMAVFRGDYHLDRAIDACLAVRTEIEKLAPVSAKGSYKPKVSIGINSGEMICGNIGSVSLSRLDYTVIGDTVNTAQRLQDAAGPGQILITQDAHNQVRESFSCREVGEIPMKNKSKATFAFEVIE